MPNYMNGHRKNTQLVSNRAYQISNLKEKLKLKYKNEEESEGPFPSLYKINEELDNAKNSNKHRSFCMNSGNPHSVLDNLDVQEFCKNSSKFHNKNTKKKSENVVLKNQNQSFESPTNNMKEYHMKDMIKETQLGESLNRSQDFRRHKTDRKNQQLLTMNRYQRTGGGYNRSILLHMISVNMKLN